ncbi:MAG: hypothetical protein WBA13_00630 [Microcoleaceae cyanobacterium]
MKLAPSKLAENRKAFVKLTGLKIACFKDVSDKSAYFRIILINFTLSRLAAIKSALVKSDFIKQAPAKPAYSR